MSAPHDFENRYALLTARENIYNLLGEREAQQQDLADLTALVERFSQRGQDEAKAAKWRAEVALQQSNYGLEISSFSDLRQHVTTALQIADDISSLPIKAKGLFYLASAAVIQGDYEQADEAAKEAFSIYEQIGDLTGQMTLLNLLGSLNAKSGNNPQAEVYHRQALTMSLELEDKLAELRAVAGLGTILWEQGQYKLASNYLRRKLRLAREIGHLKEEASALNDLGLIAAHQQDFLAAQDYYEQALHLSNSLGVVHQTSIYTYNLGTIFLNYHQDYAQAAYYFEQALQVSYEINVLEGVGYCHGRLGSAHRLLGNYEQSLTHLERGKAAFAQIKNLLGQRYILFELSLLFYDLGEYETALPYAEQALQLLKQLGNRSSTETETLTSLGNILTALSRWDEAIATYQEAIQLKDNLDGEISELEDLAGLAAVFLAQNNLSEASAHVKKILSNQAMDQENHALQVYLICYQVLVANSQNEEATNLLTTAHHMLQTRAQKIPDEALRHSFLTNVPANRELIRIFEA